MRTATEQNVSDEGQSGYVPPDGPLVAFHPGGKGGKVANPPSGKPGGPIKSAFPATVDVVITYEAFSTFTLLHFGNNSAEGTIIYTGNPDEALSLEPSVLIETVENVPDRPGPATLKLVYENGHYAWLGSADLFVTETLHNDLHTVVGRKPGTGLKLLTTRNPVKLT